MAAKVWCAGSRGQRVWSRCFDLSGVEGYHHSAVEGRLSEFLGSRDILRGRGRVFVARWVLAFGQSLGILAPPRYSSGSKGFLFASGNRGLFMGFVSCTRPVAEDSVLYFPVAEYD